MKKTIITSLSLLSFWALSSCSPAESVTEKTPRLSEEELVRRGKYLTTISGCNDCHSPKVLTELGPMPDTTRLLSGHPADEPLPELPQNSQWVMFSPGLTAAAGPWGISFAANLTPDETGIESWTYEQFEVAIRKGKFKGLEGNRTLLPPMPWPMIAQMNDDDLRAIFAYLKSLPRVRNSVPAPIPPAPLTSMK
jgi:Cytochrome c.